MKWKIWIASLSNEIELIIKNRHAMKTSGSDAFTGEFCRLVKGNNNPNSFKIEAKRIFSSPVFEAGITLTKRVKNKIQTITPISLAARIFRKI